LIVGVDEGREGVELHAIIRVVHLIELREFLSTREWILGHFVNLFGYLRLKPLHSILRFFFLRSISSKASEISSFRPLGKQLSGLPEVKRALLVL
jgi:hypothetical protein